MSTLRINLPGQPVRHIDQGPAMARLSNASQMMRRPLDVALGLERRVALPVYLEQPRR